MTIRGPGSTLVSFDEARARLRGAVSPLPPVTSSLAAARHHRLAEPVRADVDQPPGDVSAMDGYAVRHADLTGTPLPIAFDIQAGDAPEGLPPGRTARIFTGALLPEGADTIVPQEKATRERDHVTLEVVPPGSHVRRRGEVFAAGERLLDTGTTLTPGLMAVAAAAGAAHVRVVPRPRLAVLSTGSELVPVDETPEPGHIRDTNTPLMLALAADAQLDVIHSEHALDEMDPLVTTLDHARRTADVVVSAGGVSVGDFDLVPEAVRRLGGETLFHGVRVRPGKPILVARLHDSWFIGLPGNPVAVAVGWRLFVRPLAEALAGCPLALSEAPLHAVVTDAIRNDGPRLLFRPATIRPRDGTLVADIGAWIGSHDIVGAGAANGLLAIAEETSVAAGGALPFYPLPWSPFLSKDG